RITEAPARATAARHPDDRQSSRVPASTHQSRTFGIERPTIDEVLHRQRVVSAAQPMFEIQLVRFCEPAAVEFNSQASTLRHLDLAVCDHERIARQALPILPDPMRI